MRKVIIAFIAIGIIILIMSNIRITLPIIVSASIPSLSEVVNVTPGLKLIISDTNGSLALIPIKGYSAFINMVDYLSPIFVFVGIIISIALLVIKKNQKIDISDPLFFGILLMLIISLIFAFPIPTQVYLSEGSLTKTILIGINAYVGFSSIMYLISTVLLVMSTWLYREQTIMENLYSDIDQLMSMTVMLKSEEETEQSESNEEGQ
ncbi:MAG: hypothetical protein ACP5GZ_04060 [Vulcanisaeta sp.]|jgi:hypothetical protein|uniref:Uncharacterized protein n=1 Tax=Vulcanisaeta moutnovskia (strain 768-28) TaxID=985053 RepID=F0QV81_VULM7|nr:hypothetical protein [Vulcanisaeta moutnovskia]ADY00813.1 hypothetical protein VMUT_0602 [Vulcanisaeta moutnovskia 768-28]